MKKVQIFLVLFYASLCSSAQPQLFYACTGNGELLKLDITSCDTSNIGIIPGVLFDIALTPDGRLYGLNTAGALVGIDSSNASTNFIANLFLGSLNSLVSDSAGNLLTVAQDSVYQINRFTGQVISLGFFGMYNSAGDLTFYDDTLYLSADSGQLVKIILQPLSSQSVGYMNAPNIYGINTVCLNGNETMIASGGDSNFGSLYKVNTTDASLTLLCDSIVHTQLFGAASQRDFVTSKGCFIFNSINNPPADDDLKIFPNPATNIVNVSSDNPGPIVITIFDVTSKQLIRQTFSNTVSLNIENLSAGIYLFQIENAAGIFKRGKLVKGTTIR